MSPREWLSTGDGIDWPRTVLVGLALAVVLALGVVATTSTAAFGPFNPSWDGATDLRERVADSGVENHLARDTEIYEELEADGTVAFVVAPDDPYEGEDADRLREFVADGGTLVVLENFGAAGNAVLDDVGAEARVDGQLLRDERHYYRGPPMPIANGIEAENHTYTRGVDQLTLNYATAVDPGDDATVLVTTSDYAYLGDEETDLEEVDDLRAYPVATVENVSAGRVVVVGDPSIAINAMLDRPDNAAFVGNLYAGSERVVLDVSHVADVPPLTAATLLVRETPPLQLVIGVAAVGLVAALSTRRVRPTLERARRRLPGGEDRAASRALEGGRSSGTGTETGIGLNDDERVAILRRRHPEWDDERIRRVTAAVAASGDGTADATATVDENGSEGGYGYGADRGDGSKRWRAGSATRSRPPAESSPSDSDGAR